MSDQSPNETQVASLPWHKVWAYAYISPTEKTYRNLIQDPKANSNRASIWVGVSVLIVGVVPLLLYWTNGGRFIYDDIVDSGITSQGGIATIYMLLAILFGH
jgi:hypothetical protein